MEQQPIDKHGEDRTQEEAAARVTWQHAVRHVPLLLAVSALLLCLFGLLAWFVHLHPVLVLDVTIAHEVQADQDSWLRTSMLAMSYLGSSLLLVGLVVLAAVIFWVRHLRLEAVMVIGVYATNRLVNELIKLLVNRPRPTARLVEVLQQMAGASFPSGNVMNYLAFWGLLCAFGILLWRGKRWWRLLLGKRCPGGGIYLEVPGSVLPSRSTSD